MDAQQMEEEVRQLSMEHLRRNMTQIDMARTFLCIVGGVIAGVLGLTGLSGLGCFVLVCLAISGSLALLKMNGDIKMYTNMSFASFTASDLQKNGLSFILFWTLTYALVYIY
jgi:hypothetical protein